MAQMTQQDSATSPKRYYLAYGAALHPKLLKARLGSIKPISSQSVIVPNAYLAFDVPAIPYYEPCHTSAIVKGYNDQPDNDGHELVERDDDEYKQFIWHRCCPGLDFTGELPPPLEGVADELQEDDFQRLMNLSTGSSPLTAKWQVLPIEAKTFTQGDSEKPSETITVHIAVAPLTSQTMSNLQPSLRYLRYVLLGAFFSTLSQPFLGHLILLRPFSIENSRRKKLASYLIRFSLLPSFLFLHLPLNLLGIRSGRFTGWIDRLGWGTTRLLERIVRPFCGSGYSNEGEGSGNGTAI